MNLKTISVLFVTLLSSLLSDATTRKVFFVGNSYTYTNSMPDMLRDFTTAKGDTIIYSMSAPGGYTFQQHSVYAPTLSGITSQPWDVIVLQEQSQLPSFPPAQVATDVYPYATRLDSIINATDSCIETMFMMTWGRRNGDAMNCPGYPVVCTYAGMQGRLRESYMQMAQDNHASIAPMGSAWKIVIDSFPSIDLYITDSSHPSVAGSYLQACVFYASIFHKPSLGCSYLGGLSAVTAQTLQRIADKVVLDSLAQWQQYGHYPYASYTHTQPVANTIAFANHSQRAASYYWSFGDGGTDTAANPGHTYLSPGIYTVTFTAINECGNETRRDTIHVGIPTGFYTPATAANVVMTGQGGGGKTIFIMPEHNPFDALEVYGADGRLVWKSMIDAGSVTNTFVPGLYFFRAYSSDKKQVYTGKFAAY